MFAYFSTDSRGTAFPTRVHVCPANTQIGLRISRQVQILGSQGWLSNGYNVELQSTLVISNPKGFSKILRDIRTSTYQICRLEEKINRTTAFNKCICNWILEVRDMLKILWKRGEIAPAEKFLIFSTIFYYLLLDFHV